jgi:hypothetical protein
MLIDRNFYIHKFINKIIHLALYNYCITIAVDEKGKRFAISNSGGGIILPSNCILDVLHH